MPGWLEDTKEEWNKLPTWGKWTLGLVLLAVVGFALYSWYNSQQTSAGATPQAGGTGADLSGLSGSGGSGGTYPTTTSGSAGTVPILPAGINPVYDANGNLVAFGPGTQSAAPAPPTDTTAPPMPPAITPPGVGAVTQPPPMPTVAPNPIFTRYATPGDNPLAWTPQPQGNFSSQAKAAAGCVSNCLATSVQCKGKLKGSASCNAWCNGKCAARHPVGTTTGP